MATRPGPAGGLPPSPGMPSRSVGRSLSPAAARAPKTARPISPYTTLRAAERARRDRAREQAGGIVAYAADKTLTTAAYAAGGRLFRASLVSGAVEEISTAGPVVDPRPSPAGGRVAFVVGRHLWLD